MTCGSAAAAGLLAFLARYGRSRMSLGEGVRFLLVLLSRVLLLLSLFRLRRLVAHGSPPVVRVIGEMRSATFGLYHLS